MSSTALWYLSRASGVVLLVVLSLAAVLGVMSRQRTELPGMLRAATPALHRNVSLLAVALLAIHVLTSVLDPFVAIGWLAVVVPFASGYEPFRLALGALSLDLVAAVTVTSLLRKRLSWSTWRAVHWLAYAAWPLAVLHSVTAATDLQSGALLAVTLLSVGAVAGTVAWRVAWPYPSGSRRPPAAGVRPSGGRGATDVAGADRLTAVGADQLR